jgi:hypothetical protein
VRNAGKAGAKGLEDTAEMLGNQIIGPAAWLCTALDLVTNGDFGCTFLDAQFSWRRTTVTGLCQRNLPGETGS